MLEAQLGGHLTHLFLFQHRDRVVCRTHCKKTAKQSFSLFKSAQILELASGEVVLCAALPGSELGGELDDDPSVTLSQLAEAPNDLHHTSALFLAHVQIGARRSNQHRGEGCDQACTFWFKTFEPSGDHTEFVLWIVRSRFGLFQSKPFEN